MAKVVHTEDIADLNEVSEETRFKEMVDDLGGGDEVMDYITKFLGASDDAKQSDNSDKQMSLREGIKTFPKAAMWSIILSSVIIMEGYDTALLNSFYAYEPFAKKYGHLTDKGIYEVSAKWQTGLSMCTNVGEIIGLQISGIIADRLGYRKTMMSALVFVAGFIFILFFAKDVETLAVGEILCGIPWGIFQTITVSYASEVCPLVLRFYMTSFVNACWVIGQVIASGVLKGLQNNTTEWAYRVPFAIQWIYPVPLIIAIYLAPEGPYWLIRKNRYADAKKSLLRLMSKNEHNKNPELVADLMLTRLRITLENEKATTAGATFLDCFKGTNARRTRIAIGTWIGQNWTGATFQQYCTYFYEKAGLDPSNAFTFSIIQYCLGVLGVFISWFLSMRFGRFDIYFTGVAFNSVVLLVIGVLGCLKGSGASWGAGSLLLVYVLVYDMSVGPVTFCLVGELPSSRLRTKTIVLARNAYNLVGIVNAVWTPYMLNSTQWNWGAKTGFFWSGFSCMYMVWMWFDMPETKGRTFAEIDLLFEKGVKSRDFKNTEVDPFEAAALVHKLNRDQIERIIEPHQTHHGVITHEDSD